ncbi:hypothetical protein [Halodesulfovibrio sp.]|jgi:hypothetical protein|uniref:hypothetical protein n=1 Tax=Halodesulfovibrio sp. TaxID=1912772 RepID=UPI0025FE08BF|nr:hypothetical protein [Halodesulfovibrio sp.]MCT4536416.1 hypothetical protein [Halodesulfovibrio sp.]
MNRKPKKLIRLSVWMVIIVLGIMLFQIAQVPNYKNGESYRSYSPDGRYMMDLTFPKSRNADTLMILTDLERDRVVQLKPLQDDYISILEIWLCEEYSKGNDGIIVSKKVPCYEYTPQGDAGPTLTLPPSWWSQLHAWLTIQIRGTKDAQLDIVEIHEWYPPIAKK